MLLFDARCSWLAVVVDARRCCLSSVVDCCLLVVVCCLWFVVCLLLCIVCFCVLMFADVGVVYLLVMLCVAC